MRRLFLYIKNIIKRNKDSATIQLPPLKMVINKLYNYDTPHETSLFIPRVEIRETIETPFFTKTKEIIYNSITIVDAPRAPLAGEENNQEQIPYPPETFQEEPESEEESSH